MDTTQADRAALLSPGLRAQIRLMSTRDKLTAEEISEALGGIDQGLVQLALETTTAQTGSTIERVEGRLGDLSDKAIAVLENVMDYGESEFARLRAAELALKGATGGLRPRVVVNQTVEVEQMNVLIAQAAAAHAAQLKSAV